MMMLIEKESTTLSFKDEYKSRQICEKLYV